MRKLLLLLAWGGSLAEMVKSRLATQTTRPVFEQGFAARVDIACVTIDDPL